MKGAVALACLPVLVMVFQASLCLASRPDFARSLLQTAGTGAGLACTTDDQCSNGDGTSKVCSGASTICPVLAAGAPCTFKDFCSDGTERTLATMAISGTICPADPATKTGICPFVPAGNPCRTNDYCATDATNSAICVAGRTGSGVCPTMLSGVTCSALAGECSGDQDCSAPWVVKDPKAVLLTGDLINGQDSSRGVCVGDTAAGSACKPGLDLCSGYGVNAANEFCSASPCPLARPGQTCSDASPRDKCFDDSTDGGRLCPLSGSPGSGSICPALAADKKCLAGDLCAAGQACNGVGTTVGQCVIAKGPGAACTPAVAASTSGGQTTPASPADKCQVTLVDAVFNGVVVAQDCATSATKCPSTPAGQACVSTDKCSDGGVTTGGVSCPGTGKCLILGVSGLTSNNAANGACLASDQCGNGQVCNAPPSGAGTCVTPKTAGATCTPEVPAVTGGAGRTPPDYCTPSNAACPTGGKCPAVPAGGPCVPAGGGRLADKCFNGNSDATKATTDCAASTNQCPALVTGLTCTVGLDLCVRGAQCISGICQPVSKAFPQSSTPAATTVAKTASTGFSTQANVPAVTLSPTLTNYDITNFTGSVLTTYCNTIQTNIMSAYKVVSNCSTGTPAAGSVVVPTTVAFSGSDSNAATAAQTSFSTDLKNKVTSVFGSAYGTVTVPATSVQSVTTSNPEAATKSGAAAVGMAWTVGVAFMVSALVIIV